jgi:uncharacterized membrane protein
MHRYAEIDLLRGVAIGGMILFHFLFDLDFFGIVELNLTTGFWFWFARTTAFSFVFLAGLSVVLYAQRHGEIKINSLRLRGISIFLWGMVLTLITYLTYPTFTIYFGVLHLLGVCLFVSPYFLSRPRTSLVVGIILFIIGIILSASELSGITPHWMGILPFPFPSFDYFPLFPWMGVFLLGVASGFHLYGLDKIHPKLGWKSLPRMFHPFQWAGRHSLMIYLIHQPILLFLVWGFSLV